MGFFSVTYETITADGDQADSGFLDRYGFPRALEDRPPAMPLREALRLASPQEDSGFWFSEVDPRHDWRNGNQEFRAIHPPRNITRASYNRVKRAIAHETRLPIN